MKISFGCSRRIPGTAHGGGGEHRAPTSWTAPAHCVPACPLGGGHSVGPAGLRAGPPVWIGAGRLRWVLSRLAACADPVFGTEGGALPRPPLGFGVFCADGPLVSFIRLTRMLTVFIAGFFILPLCCGVLLRVLFQCCISGILGAACQELASLCFCGATSQSFRDYLSAIKRMKIPSPSRSCRYSCGNP